MMNIHPSYADIRKPLSCVSLDFGDYRCRDIQLLSNNGSSGLVYQAISDDFYGSGKPSANLIIKECYPLELARCIHRNNNVLEMSDEADSSDRALFNRYLDRYHKAFSNNASLRQGCAREQISTPSRACSINGTLYIINNASHGTTMDAAFASMSVYQQLKALLRLGETLAAIHNAGYVYLDLKPENILCIKNPNDDTQFTDDIRLFDFDSTLSLKELSEDDVIVSGSGDWSAFEQTHPGHIHEVGIPSDIYSLGALLFWTLVGRPPKTTEVIHADGDWMVSGSSLPSLGDKASHDQIACIKRIFDHTLCIQPARRYQSAQPFIENINKLAELLMPTNETMNARFDEVINLLKNFAQEPNQQDSLHVRADTLASNIPDTATLIIEPSVASDSNTEKENSFVTEPNLTNCNLTLPSPPKPSLQDVVMTAVLLSQLSEQLADSLSKEARASILAHVESLAAYVDERDLAALISEDERTTILCNALMSIDIFNTLENMCPDETKKALDYFDGQLDEAIAQCRYKDIERLISTNESRSNLLQSMLQIDAASSCLKEDLSDKMQTEIEKVLSSANNALIENDPEIMDALASQISSILALAKNDAIMGMMGKLF
ncbi:protein kinase domain-containing protein [Enorma sp.]|uniref:protein kinase domain-containing protein n=1 Tax=Enorma sp. TaxID=1920692 RepID=UPI003AB1341B